MTEVVQNGKATPDAYSADAIRPFLDAMIKEGSSVMKPPCDDSTIVNDSVAYCLKGSPWVQEMAIPLLIGQLQNELISVVNDDNFHRATDLFPYHHPEMNGTCALDTTVPCTINHFSITQNAYNPLDELDTGKQSISAYEMRVKLKSSQSIHIAAGEADASFEALDLQGDECMRINQAAWDYAYSIASDSAKANYDAYGQKAIMVPDRVQTNGGLWIYEPLREKNAADKTYKEISSLALPLDSNHRMEMMQDMHYCKLLSPFRALEYLYVDSQYAHGGYQPESASFNQ